MRRIFLICLFLSGCATTAGYEKVLSSWVGQSADRLISSWGAPANTTQLSGGSRVLEYSNQRNIQLGGYTTTVPQTTVQNGTANIYGNNGASASGTYNGTSTTYVQQTTPIQNITMSCSTRFTVNSQNIITNWAWQGNDCKAKEPPQQTQQNADEASRKRVENTQRLKLIDEKVTIICAKSEYSALFLKAPCRGTDITLANLVDRNKIAPELKEMLLHYRVDMDAYSKERNEFLRQIGSPADLQWTNYLNFTVQSEIDKYNLNLYNEKISWGEYNQARKDLNANLAIKYKEFFPQTK